MSTLVYVAHENIKGSKEGREGGQTNKQSLYTQNNEHH